MLKKVIILHEGCTLLLTMQTSLYVQLSLHVASCRREKGEACAYSIFILGFYPTRCLFAPVVLFPVRILLIGILVVFRLNKLFTLKMLHCIKERLFGGATNFDRNWGRCNKFPAVTRWSNNILNNKPALLEAQEADLKSGTSSFIS